MLKQYFTDGLVQIAIVLSLLRTDLNNYINHNYVSYPEVQEIILGQTAAYTQTNFHNSYNFQLGSPEIYRKNINPERTFISSIYRDLRSLRHISSSRDIDIPTFLLVSGSSSGFISQEANEQQHDNDDVDNNNNNNNNSTNEEMQLSSVDLEAQGQTLLNTLEQTLDAMGIVPLLHSLQPADPTSEDLDLIEVLWRQDIDLGVGKEVFDPNLRRELEREREIELQKNRQKQKEQELLQKQLEKQRQHAQQRWLNDNFTQDGETGEWVPLGGNRVPPPPPPEMGGTVGPDGETFLSNFDNMPLLSDEIQQDNNGSYGNMHGQSNRSNHMPPQYQGPQPIHPQSAQMYGNGQYGPNTTQQQQYRHHQQQQCNMMNNNQTYQQQQHQYNNNNTQNFNHSQQNYTQLQTVPQQQQQQQQQPQPQQSGQDYPRQSSLEATWQDLVNILDLPPNQTQSSVQPIQTHTNHQNHGDGMMMNNSIQTSVMSPLDNTSSMLIQNATMPTPAPMNGNVTFNNTGVVSQQNHRSPPHSTGMMSPGQNYNSSIPGGSGVNTLEWDNYGDFLLPNITANLTTSPGLEDVDELLPDLITEDELDEINFAEMELTDGMSPPPPSHTCSDDMSSDSAVSMGSQSDGSADMNDFSDGTVSPFDGIEGATGGQDGSKFSKTSAYDPDDFKYGKSCSYSGGDSNGSNFSSSSNDTSGAGHHYGQNNGHFGHSPNNGHINHNHSYPLKPGADPKDIKKHMFNNERRQKGPQSKDHKKVSELKVPFSVDQIVGSPVEEFNDMLTRHKLTDQQLQLVRDIRRRGKNKVAAQNCRKRKMGALEHLEDEMGSLEKMRDKLLHERHSMDKHTREMKDKLGNLYSEIFHSLRDEHGHPYDPARYSLQQSSDGDVFLVPRNYTTDEDLNKKRKNDRN